MCIYIYNYIHTNTYIYIYLHIYLSISISISISICIHAYIYTYIHTSAFCPQGESSSGFCSYAELIWAWRKYHAFYTQELPSNDSSALRPQGGSSSGFCSYAAHIWEWRPAARAASRRASLERGWPRSYLPASSSHGSRRRRSLPLARLPCSSADTGL